MFVGVCWFSLAFDDFRWFWLAGLVGFAGLKLGIDAFGLVMLDCGRFWSVLHDLNGSAVEVQWKCNGSAVEVQWKCSGSAMFVQCLCSGSAVEVLWKCSGSAMEVQWEGGGSAVNAQ